MKNSKPSRKQFEYDFLHFDTDCARAINTIA